MNTCNERKKEFPGFWHGVAVGAGLMIASWLLGTALALVVMSVG